MDAMRRRYPPTAEGNPTHSTSEEFHYMIITLPNIDEGFFHCRKIKEDLHIPLNMLIVDENNVSLPAKCVQMRNIKTILGFGNIGT